MIVDAAIRSGKTLQSLVGILRKDSHLSIKVSIGFYAIDGLFDKPRIEMEKELGVEFTASSGSRSAHQQSQLGHIAANG